jgi:hypothetical protein
MTGTAVRGRAPRGVAGTSENEGRYGAIGVENSNAPCCGREIKDSVDVVAAGADVIDRDQEGVLLRAAGAGGRVIDQAAGFVPIIVRNIRVPDRILSLLFPVQQYVSLLLFAD